MRPQYIALLLLISSSFLLGTNAQRYVDLLGLGTPGEGCLEAKPCPSIADALTAGATNGDTINIAAGTYSGAGNVDLPSQTKPFAFVGVNSTSTIIVGGAGFLNTSAQVSFTGIGFRDFTSAVFTVSPSSTATAVVSYALFRFMYLIYRWEFVVIAQGCCLCLVLLKKEKRGEYFCKQRACF
jgi:hypothetical protein